MSALNLSDSRITHRQQIVQLLKMAIDQRWRFTYVSVIKNHVDSCPITLTSVNVEEGTFEVSPEIERTAQNLREPIIFRGESGGISAVFKARAAGVATVDPEQTPTRHYTIDLPYEVRCTQLRKSLRLQVETLAEPMPAVLYLAMGVQVDAELVDISSTGAQFKVKKDLTAQLKNLQVLEACKVSLTDDLIVRCGAQLLGISYNPNLNTSFLRCQFVQLPAADEARLERYIEAALTEADPALVVISS